MEAFHLTVASNKNTSALELLLNEQRIEKDCKHLQFLKCLPMKLTSSFLLTFWAKRETEQLKHVRQKWYKNVNKLISSTTTNKLGLKKPKRIFFDSHYPSLSMEYDRKDETVWNSAFLSFVVAQSDIMVLCE